MFLPSVCVYMIMAKEAVSLMVGMRWRDPCLGSSKSRRWLCSWVKPLSLGAKWFIDIWHVEDYGVAYFQDERRQSQMPRQLWGKCWKSYLEVFWSSCVWTIWGPFLVFNKLHFPSPSWAFGLGFYCLGTDDILLLDFVIFSNHHYLQGIMFSSTCSW